MEGYAIASRGHSWPQRSHRPRGPDRRPPRRRQAVSCKSTLKIGFVAPFTGGAGFLGNEQLSWAKYAVKTLAPKYGLKIKLVTGDTPVEQGPAIGADARAEVRRRQGGRRGHRAVDVGLRRRVESDVLPGRAGAHLAVGDPNVADEGRDRRRRPVRSSASCRATTSRARRTRTSWSQAEGAKKVVLFDFQEPYSQGLAGAVGDGPEGEGRLDAPASRSRTRRRTTRHS